MDVLTHFLLPFAAATALRRPRAERLAAGIGGYAPDLDILWTWVPRLWPEAYPFVHRGFSHSVWGGALLAVALLWLLSRPALAARWKLLAGLAFTSATAAVAVAGSFTHTLLLDALTITGTPAFWPLTLDRWTVNWFYWGVTWALPASLAVLVLRLRGRLSERGLVAGAGIVVLIIVVAGGVRAATQPSVEAGLVIPTSSEHRWIVAEPVEGPNGTAGWRVGEVTWGSPGQSRTYFGNATAAAHAALDACRETGAYTAWRWGGLRAPVVDAVPVPGGWALRFLDAASRFEWEEGEFSFLGWKPPIGPNRDEPYQTEERGLRCTVVAGVVTETRRPASIWG